MLTSPIEQIPSWEADSRSVGEEILCLSWNAEVHYRVHKNQPLDYILRRINTDYSLTLCSPQEYPPTYT
jgi:hypothetical protein